MKLKLFDLFLVLGFIALIVVAVVYLNYYKTEGAKCLNDPLSFAQDKIKSLNGESAMCSCQAIIPGEFIPVSFCASRCAE